MAISPIQIFQPQGGGIVDALNRGQATFADALNNLMQVGRTNADKQMQQERDFLSERGRLEALEQRKGEFGSTMAQRQREFLRGAFESDRGFAASEAERARAQDRFETQEQRLARESAQRMSLSRMQEERLGSQFDFEKSQAEQDRERRERERASIAGLFSADQPAPIDPNAPTRPSDVFRTRPSSSPLEEEPPATGGDMTPEEIIAEGRLKQEAARAQGNADLMREGAMQVAQGEAALREAETAARASGGSGGGAVSPFTTSQLLSSLKGKEAQEMNRMGDMVATEVKAFLPAVMSVPAPADPNNPTPEELQAQETAQAVDAARVEREFLKAREMDKDAYVNVVDEWAKTDDGSAGWIPMSASEVKKAKEARRKLWEFARQPTLDDQIAAFAEQLGFPEPPSSDRNYSGAQNPQPAPVRRTTGSRPESERPDDIINRALGR